MKNSLTAVIPLILLVCSWNMAQASNITFSLTSKHGNSACHNPDKNYTFDFKVNVPPEEVRMIGNDEYTYTYVVNKVIIHDKQSYSSVMDGVLRASRQEFVEKKEGSVVINYREAWRADNIELYIRAEIDYRTTIKRRNDQGELGPSEFFSVRPVDQSSNTYFFTLGDYLTQPETIVVDGVVQNNINIDATQGCQVYTLDAGTVEGVDRYQWVLGSAVTLVSHPTSLFSNSIQVQPSFGGTVRLRLIQDCDGARVKEKTFQVVPQLDITTDKSIICDDGSLARFSVPQPAPGVSVSWTFDNTKLTQPFPANYLLGLMANGNPSGFADVSATVSSSCGTVTETVRVFVGTPSTPVTDPSGYPTVQHTYQGFKNYSVISDHNGQGVTNYNWWVTPNNLPITNPNNATCIIEGTTIGWYNFYVQLTNICGTSAVSGGALQVVDNSGGGGPINPKRLNSPNLAPAISSFSLQPNPASDQVRLNLLDAAGAVLKVTTLQVEVLDLNGKVVATSSQPQLEVSELTSGVYVVRMHSEGQWLTQKLVIE